MTERFRIKKAKKGAIAVEKIIISSASVLLSGVIITGGVTASKEASTNGLSKIESKSEDITGGPPEEKLPETTIPEELYANVSFSFDMNGKNYIHGNDTTYGVDAFEIGGVPLNLNYPEKTIAANKVLNQGKDEFLFDSSKFEFHTPTKKEYHSYSQYSINNFKNGNVQYEQGNPIGGELRIASPYFDKRDTDSIAKFFEENYNTFAPIGVGNLWINTKELIEFKYIKLNNKLIPQDIVDGLATNSNAQFNRIDLSYFKGIQPKYSPNNGFGADPISSQENIIFNVMDKTSDKKPLNDYLDGFKGLTNTSDKFITDGGTLTYSFPIEAESKGGLKYKFNVNHAVKIVIDRVDWKA